MACGSKDDTPKPMGVNKNRSCRDLLFLLLFIVYWVGMWIVASVAIANGDPTRLTVPRDYLDQYCGLNNADITTNNSTEDLTEKPYLYYINPDQITFSASVCVESCPGTTELVTMENVVCTYDEYPASDTELIIQVVSKQCSSFVYASTPILQRCVPINPIPLETLVSAAQTYGGNETIPGTGVSANEIMNSGRTVTMQVVADLVTSKWIIVGSTFASVVVCFIYIILLRFFARPMVWATILVTNLVLGALGVWLYFYFKSFEDYYYAIEESLRTDMQTWELRGIFAALIVVGLMFAVIFLVSVFLRKRIAIAIEITREAAKAIGSMPLIVFYPLVDFLFMLCLLAYFSVIFLYIITPADDITSLTLTNPISTSAIDSVQDALSNNGFVNASDYTDINSFNTSSISSYEITDSNLSLYMRYYHIFGCLWGWGVLSGIGQVTFAGSIATYYWTLDKKTMTKMPILKALYRTLRYHLGSVCVGGFLLAVVRMIRVIMWSIKKQAQGIKKVPFMGFAFYCADCCLRCLEGIVKYINRKAYIMIAIDGKGFCCAAFQAFALILRNILRVAAVDFVSMFVMFLGKLAISAAVFFGTWTILKMKADELGLSFTFVPAIVCALIAFILASMFLSLFEASIDTILLCFLEDSEVNDGTAQKPYYMSQALMNLTKVTNVRQVEPMKVKSSQPQAIRTSVTNDEF